MPVLTEAKIRKLLKESSIVKGGVVELAQGEKLTPAAMGFLSDHHIKVVHSNQPKGGAFGTHAKSSKGPVKNIEDSAVCPLLFRLTGLYPYYLKNQHMLHSAFQEEKCQQFTLFLDVLENMVGQRVLDDIADYHSDFLTSAELQAIRVTRQLDQEGVRFSYQVPEWRLACYESYMQTLLLRKELERLLKNDSDDFVMKVLQLLKSLEVMLWLLASD